MQLKSCILNKEIHISDDDNRITDCHSIVRYFGTFEEWIINSIKWLFGSAIQTKQTIRYEFVSRGSSLMLLWKYGKLNDKYSFQTNYTDLGEFKVYRGKKNSNDVGRVISFNDDTGK